MRNAFDLDAYLHRIGYRGARAPTPSALAAICLAHAQTIAFEALDPLLGRPVSTDIEAVQDKIIHARRGGYCFEQNTLLQHALETLGFAVTGLSARVVLNVPPESALPRTHMLLRIDFDDGPVIADVGFGGLTLTAPLRLVPDVAQETPHGLFRLVGDGGEYRLEARVGDVWTALYRFGLQAQIAADYAMMNYYSATHPSSIFRHNLMAARPFPGGRWALGNGSLTQHRLDGESERRALTSAGEIRAVLEDIFDIRLPDDSGLEPMLARFATGSRE